MFLGQRTWRWDTWDTLEKHYKNVIPFRRADTPTSITQTSPNQTKQNMGEKATALPTAKILPKSKPKAVCPTGSQGEWTDLPDKLANRHRQ